MTDLRCSNKFFGQLLNGYIEVKCNSRWCGASAGKVILHRFDINTGKLLETKVYKNPQGRKT